MAEAVHRIARELEVKGPLNVQFIVYDDVYIMRRIFG
jgi:carbamoyl-phosphate synthase large subunit